MHLVSSWLVMSLLVQAVTGITEPTPMPNAPAGDRAVVVPTAAPEQPVTSAAPVIEPTPAAPDGDPDVTFLPGRALVIGRACVDDNADNRCTVGEELVGLHLTAVDAVTGDVLATATTDQSGRAMLQLDIVKRSQVSVDAPFLGASLLAYPEQGGVELLVRAPVLPVRLPSEATP
jgi:hypothetical protein